MKFYLLSDNIDTQMGMRLAGIEGVVVHERHEVLEELERVMHMEDIAIVLMTTKLIETCPEVISELKLKQKETADCRDSRPSWLRKRSGETIDRYVSEAIGVKL